MVVQLVANQCTRVRFPYPAPMIEWSYKEIDAHLANKPEPKVLPFDENGLVSYYSKLGKNDHLQSSDLALQTLFKEIKNKERTLEAQYHSQVQELEALIDLRNQENKKAINPIKKSATTIFTQLRKVYIDFMTSFDLTNAEKYYKHNYGRSNYNS